MVVQKETFLRPGELARRTGVSTDTLRHYERCGLLPRARRSHNKYREYPLTSVERVELIRRALSIGFTIRELGQILRERDGGKPPCMQVFSLAEQKLSATRIKLKELKSLERELTRILREWRQKLKSQEPGKSAGLLDWLSRSPRNGKPAGIVHRPAFTGKRNKE